MKIIPAYDKETDSYREVLVSDEDFEYLNRKRWRITDGYCGTMHRIVAKRMGISDLPGVIDHVNRNKCDNRRENLRKTSHGSNLRNTDKRNPLDVTGVFWNDVAQVWHARLAGTTIGNYNSIDEAVHAFKNYVILKSHLVKGVFD